jgi:hypothetical protein
MINHHQHASRSAQRHALLPATFRGYANQLRSAPLHSTPHKKYRGNRIPRAPAGKEEEEPTATAAVPRHHIPIPFFFLLRSKYCLVGCSPSRLQSLRRTLFRLTCRARRSWRGKLKAPTPTTNLSPTSTGAKRIRKTRAEEQRVARGEEECELEEASYYWK